MFMLLSIMWHALQPRNLNKRQNICKMEVHVFGASYFTIVVLLRARVETLRELVIRDTHALGEITKFAVRYLHLSQFHMTTDI